MTAVVRASDMHCSSCGGRRWRSPEGADDEARTASVNMVTSMVKRMYSKGQYHRKDLLKSGLSGKKKIQGGGAPTYGTFNVGIGGHLRDTREDDKTGF